MSEPPGGGERVSCPGGSGMPRTESRAFAIANVAMLAAFVLSAAVQWNDPDPWRWVAIYVAAAVACVLGRRVGRGARLLAAVVGAAALLWASSLAPRALADLRPGDLVREMEASTPAIELGREMFGLLLVAGWMAVLVTVGRPRPENETRSEPRRSGPRP